VRNRGKLALNGALACGLVLVLAGCGRSDRQRRGEPDDSVIWFVHATDPHLFLDTAQDKATEKTGAKQQDLDKTALVDMLKGIHFLPDGNGAPAFLVLTGDFGVDPCPIATSHNQSQDCATSADKTKRGEQIKLLADALGTSPVEDIYLVSGNNDVALEVPDDVALAYFNTFIDDVQGELVKAGKTVHLHNLTRCYAAGGGPETGCFADLANSSYRLIGFPSHSFKNRESPDSNTTAANAPAQEQQWETFSKLLKDARDHGRKVLIITHIPEIDDPYYLAVNRYRAPEADKNGKVPPPPSITAWNVSQKVMDGWRDALAADSVIGVLAGHLHDSHKEIYRQPYTWSSDNDHRLGFRKLFVAPPLSVKNQDTSPIQARGFAVMRLADDELQARLYWYNSETREFSPDQAPRFERPQRHGWHLAPSIMWLWQLGEPQAALDRMAVLLIAFLAAFLTVVQIWQIPPADNPLTGKETAPASGAGGGGAAAAKPAFEPSPFASNFGKTVVTGLGGLAAEMVLKAFEGKPSSVDKEFYIVWFIVFFFLLLILLALFRAFAEAVRARLAIIQYPLARQPEPPKRWVRKRGVEVPVEEPLKWYTKFGRSLAYWGQRFIHWIFSLRVPLLTFFDTFINLIQGKNQTMTREFSNTIVEQQRNVVRTADAIRKNLNSLLYRTLSRLDPDGERTPQDVRVNISVLSADQTNVFYIARTPGSSLKPFGKRSVAWVSVFTGKIRWYKERYFEDKELFPKIVLFDNTGGTIPGDEAQIHLSSHYQQRDGDYEAFILFPVPWPQRGFDSDYVKGAIHISFRNQEDFERLWSFDFSYGQQDVKLVKAIQKIDAEIQAAKSDEERRRLQEDLKLLKDIQKIDAEIQAAENKKERKSLQEHRQQKIEAAHLKTCDPVIDEQIYSNEQRALEDWCKDPEVRATLREAIAVLGELLRGFNENIYNSRGGSDQPS